ncbi:MAG: LytR/AlgR family response regulator transcription factor [Solirubrobacterales bacterium]
MPIAVVVDNNPQELQQTVCQLKESGVFTAINSFRDSLEAIKYIELHSCDIVFTEVEMVGVNGFDFIRRVGINHTDILIVFVTNKSNYALQAFEYDTADFIMKPVDKESIKRVMKRFKGNHIR